jgi:hypothetical protein
MLSATFALLPQVAAARSVLVTGATGRTGVLTYQALQASGLQPGSELRALVRSQDKARSLLGCQACDESEGIFVGDVLQEDSLAAAMDGVETLVITVGTPEPRCILKLIACHYPQGATPRDVNFIGARNQVSAFAQANSTKSLAEKHVVLMSTTMTTNPTFIFDRLWGHGFFYHLNGETELLQSGLGFTIVKACGLSNGPADTKKLVVGRDDEFLEANVGNMMHRSDVAPVLAAAALIPSESLGLRFDLCMSKSAPASGDVHRIFKEAALPWELKAVTV